MLIVWRETVQSTACVKGHHPPPRNSVFWSDLYSSSSLSQEKLKNVESLYGHSYLRRWISGLSFIYRIFICC